MRPRVGGMVRFGRSGAPLDEGSMDMDDDFDVTYGSEYDQYEGPAGQLLNAALDKVSILHKDLKEVNRELDYSSETPIHWCELER